VDGSQDIKLPVIENNLTMAGSSAVFHKLGFLYSFDCLRVLCRTELPEGHPLPLLPCLVAGQVEHLHRLHLQLSPFGAASTTGLWLHSAGFVASVVVESWLVPS
jgi:hypothetical protein